MPKIDFKSPAVLMKPGLASGPGMGCLIHAMGLRIYDIGYTALSILKLTFPETL